MSRRIGINSVELDNIFFEVFSMYPKGFHNVLHANKARIRWQVETVLKHVPLGGRLIDIGGGIVPFMLVCQKLGYETIIIDDLEDETCKDESSKKVVDYFEKNGVMFIHGDAFSADFGALGAMEFDLVTSHDSMEHWHHSPKRLFHSLWGMMKEGGLFWISAPNCVNLRKRITVPFGHGKWTKMKDWYEPATFRGHVREPDVDDLRYIARDLGAARIEIIGRNWIGYRHPSVFVRAITSYIDQAMRLFPSICSDIYLFAWK